MIPQDKLEPVTRALHDTFGTTQYDDIAPLAGGNATSRAFRIVVRGAPYFLRMSLRSDSAARHFDCLRAAAAAGLAPRVWYTNVEDKVSITDLVDAVPLTRDTALVRLPRALRALHALPPFITAPNHINTTCTFFLNPGPPVDAFLDAFLAKKTFRKADTRDMFAIYDQILATYSAMSPDLASSHNDIKPENILYDGDRVWLIDWEAAFFNDRYNDPAVLANLIVTDDPGEWVFLREYFGQPPTPYQSARFFFMRQVHHLFVALGYIFLGALKIPVDLAEPVPDYDDFHRRLWAWEIDLSDPRNKILYARVHLARLFENVGAPRWTEALSILAADS